MHLHASGYKCMQVIYVLLFAMQNMQIEIVTLFVLQLMGHKKTLYQDGN